MDASARGVVAAGHPLTAEAGARVLRAGGNAVDAAVAAMLCSCVAESLLTGLGAGGYLLVAGGRWEPCLLDFFVQAPRRATDGSAAELIAVDVSFGAASQVFHIGPDSCGIYGVPAGVCRAIELWGTMALSDLAEPAALLAADGVQVNAQQAYVAEILTDLLCSTPECRALWAPRGHVLREGERLCDVDLAGALQRLGREGSSPFYQGDIARAVCAWLRARGGSLRIEELASYQAIERKPVTVAYRDRRVLTNPPPSAGGALLAYALSELDRSPGAPSLGAIVTAMAAAQRRRTPQFLEGLTQEGFLERFLAAGPGGSTTHISVLDADGGACSVTCTNGEGSGVIVPGTGIHLNNIMGEQDLNPLGFHRHPAGRRMPSMMAPSVVVRGSEVELVLGSAGSNRIRSALLQAIVAVVDRGLDAQAAVEAPRAHYEDGIVYAEPGLDIAELQSEGCEIVCFAERSLFFGGTQLVLSRDGVISGAGDPRRGGVAAA